MKKIFFAVALMFATVVSAKAGDRERPITVEQLPAAAQQFLAQNFKDLTVAFVVEDTKFVGSEYEVTYTDRTEIDFDSQGQWSCIERKYSALPASLIPQQIADAVAKSNFPGQYVKKIERNAYTWEVELSNGLEIKFDKQFNIIGYDD